MADYTVNYEEIGEWLRIYKSTEDEKQKKHLQNVIALAAMPLVKKIARGLARRNTDPVEDIIQVGNVGLVKAIQLYNPKVSENFKTYATYLITGEIRHYLRDKVSMIKAPREIYELAYRVSKLMQKLKDDQGNEPSEIVLAEELGTSVGKIKEVIDAIKYYFEKTGRRIIIEYTLIKGVNDKDEHAKQLAKLLKGIVCLVNVIKLNEVKEKDFVSPSRKEVYDFVDKLTQNRLEATARRTMGDDIDGACGQLRKNFIKNNI